MSLTRATEGSWKSVPREYVTHMFVPDKNPWSQAHLLHTTL